jgi:hypothetical protein
MFLLPLLLAATATTPPTAVPRPSPTHPPPRLTFAEAPSKEMAELAAFEGTWSCESASAETKPPTRYELTLRRDLAGFWYSGRVTEASTAENPRPTTRLFFWGHDAVLGKFVGGWLDSRGGWSAQTSMGWEGEERDRLVFLGHVTATGEKVTARETFTRPEEGAFTRTYDVLGFIEWTRISEEHCRRASAPR